MIGCWSRGIQRCGKNKGGFRIGSGYRYGGKKLKNIIENEWVRFRKMKEMLQRMILYEQRVLMVLIEKVSQ